MILSITHFLVNQVTKHRIYCAEIANFEREICLCCFSLLFAITDIRLITTLKINTKKILKMINRNFYIQSLLLGKKTIIIYKEAAESIFVPTIWLIIFVVLLLTIFILCHARYPEDDSDADDPFELSRIQPNYCYTNDSTEVRGDSRRDH